MNVRGERYVVLGLAHVRSEWFRAVAHWSTSASLPVEFVKCVSVEELRARLTSGRAFSAVLVDAGLPGVDRDLLDEARAGGCAALVVDNGRAPRDWVALGAGAVLPAFFERGELLQALAETATPIGRGDSVLLTEGPVPNAGWRGRLVAIAGVGGAGTSTVAMALAQGLGSDPRYQGLVLLADLALHADQAMLHDVGDIVPGVQELVEAHRGGQPSMQDTRALTFSLPERQYNLLLGLRRHRDWATIRPRAFEAALDGLRRCYKVTVADITGDLEGEDQCGSIDVEERNLMARTAVGFADAVLLVGGPGPRGLHRLVRLIASAIDHGVPVPRLVPIVNHAPRNPHARAEVTAALADLARSLTQTGLPLAPPLQLPERRRLDEVVRDVSRLPSALVTPVTAAVLALFDRVDSIDPPAMMIDPQAIAIAPGSIGSYHEAGS
ncbi:MAG: hypothetical protein ACR2LQ_11030 [Acidimicrobiales bacterium]